MQLNMDDINRFVLNRMIENGIDYTYDNRIAVLSELAKNIAADEDIDIFTRSSVPLEIAVEIVRLRTEKQMFEP